ncbi:MAG: glycerol-3-phosphate 1-O-acyltransferase PlsY [Clostridia bacterium]|nr:glycerol-3-phosphate 1-O-acyltransferase PlsY [Clostridia bacterium]
MSRAAALLLSAVIGYVLGSVSTGILYSRALGRDIRTQGSKNSGATNMTRVHGLKKGGLTFLGDCLKGVLAALIGKWLGGQTGAVVGGTFAVLGHMWPIFFGFQGGKGVATCIGIGFVTYPLFGGLALLIGVAVMLISKFVSLGSMLGLIAFAIGVTLYYGLWPIGLWGIGLAALVVWRHRSNIKRLMNGTENRIGKSK